MEQKEKGSKYQRAIYGILQDFPIAYSPRLSVVLGSINASILMGQLLYWRGKGLYDPWVYKTIEEMKEETGMSRSEQDTAIRKCKNLGVLTAVRRGIPAKRYFLINIERLIDLVDGWAKNNPQVLKISPKSIVGIKQTITNNTNQDNSHESTAPILKKVKRRVMLKRNHEFLETKNHLVSLKSMSK